jgi:hypothetical protein
MLPAKLGATPDLSLQRRATTSSALVSNTKLVPSAAGATPGTELRRRSVPPGASQPVAPPREPSIYGATPGQTNGQGFMQRKCYNYFVTWISLLYQSIAHLLLHIESQ